MPPLPSPNDARGRYLLRIYTAALGYAVGHSYITVYGYTYERMVAGVFGIIAIALVVLALILAHARAEMENWHAIEAEADRVRATRASSAPWTQSHPTALD